MTLLLCGKLFKKNNQNQKERGDRSNKNINGKDWVYPQRFQGQEKDPKTLVVQPLEFLLLEYSLEGILILG